MNEIYSTTDRKSKIQLTPVKDMEALSTCHNKYKYLILMGFSLKVVNEEVTGRKRSTKLKKSKFR